MKSIKPEKLARDLIHWEQDDLVDWFEAWKEEKDNTIVTRLFEQQIAVAVRSEDAWYFNELIKLYYDHHPAGMYQYLPRISHFIFSKDTKDDYPHNEMQKELALSYYAVDKHNWEINQFLQQLMYHSEDARVREQVRQSAPSLQVEDISKVPLPLKAEKIRHRLVLFLNPETAASIGPIRQTYDPMQANLVAAHTTLCGENELVNMERVLHNLSILYLPPVLIHFGPPECFADDFGLHIPESGENSGFRELRRKVLQGVVDEPSPLKASVILIDPRSGINTRAVVAELTKTQFPTDITFDECCLIRQEGSDPWEIIRRFPLVK